jgi:hypothetical protein
MRLRDASVAIPQHLDERALMVMKSDVVTFVVAGEALPEARQSQLPEQGNVRGAVRITACRASTQSVRLTAQPGADIVVLHLANGPTLYLHPLHASELLRAQQVATDRGNDDLALAPGEVRVPAQLGWSMPDDGIVQPGTRGIADRVGPVMLDAIEVITGLLQDTAACMASAAVTRNLDGQVEAGVYRLDPNQLLPLKGSGRKLAQVPAATEPLLVLMHGAFVETRSTFGALWSQHPTRVAALFERYGGRVYALDHPTVGVSPFGNALTLVRALPKGARLHLLTHSRGGIVGEVLARLCGGRGLASSDLELFAGEAYRQHRTELAELAAQIEQRQLRVERIVRVACPARGTLFASRRLDAYLSVFKWGLQLAGAPILPELVSFIAEVARHRAEPEEMPGTEAMMPDRPVARWLNAPSEPVTGQLRVVAGDIEGDSLTSWLKTLLSDAFYWSDNDLVVQTRSMYGGAPRELNAASFALDRSGRVTHFNYFANERTAELISRGLLDAQPSGFDPIGPLSWAGAEASGKRAARALASQTGERPAVFVLPGMLGSHLRRGDERLWLTLRSIGEMEQLAWNPLTADTIEADGPVESSYRALLEHLAATHEVLPFGFDWRRPIEDSARRLAGAVEVALRARQHSQQPVRFLAHSIGGLVVRALRLECFETWQRCMAQPGARVLMLGTPNGGSFLPMQLLSGDDSFGQLLMMFGPLFAGAAARQLLADMPGFMQLQAGLSELGLQTRAAWLDLAQADLQRIERRAAAGAWWHNTPIQQRALQWAIPSQSTLDAAVILRQRLDAQLATLGADAAKIVLVVGKAAATPAALQRAASGLQYLDVADGDGRVTLANALLPGVEAWQLDVGHGALPSAKHAFAAYVELLMQGETRLLPRIAGTGMRGITPATAAACCVPSRPARTLGAATPPPQLGDVLAPPAEQAAVSHDQLHVRVVNGNLKFVREPLLLGHYSSLKLTGTEWAIDQLLDNKMTQSLHAGLYPASIGSQQVFTNTLPCRLNPFALLPRPGAAIVVGLGEEGALTLSLLIDTVRQGVLAYAQRVAERGQPSQPFELAATLLGSGGSSISPGLAAQGVTLGVREANVLLAGIGWPRVATLHLIELYLDRAAEAVEALRSLRNGGASDLHVESEIASGQGALPRPVHAGYRMTDYDFVAVRQRRHETSTELEFALATRRARDEIRGSIVQSDLVNELVGIDASNASDDPRIGRALFKLLMPPELEPFLTQTSALLLQLDRESAAYPWEMLDLQRNGVAHEGQALPWAIRTRLLRKLRTAQFRTEPRTASSADGVVVIGAPQCPPETYPPLPAATAEAREVAAILGAQPILNAGALSIIQSVLDDRSYAILHVAGHGDIIEGVGGVVLSNGVTFGSREVQSMRSVPQLAFINCCHLGRFADQPPKIPEGGLPRFAANIAEELIAAGVHCVIAAGWAVQDAAARLFATTFYRHLTDRERPAQFVDAVYEARRATYERYPNSNTWAAYQCYGDPNWTYRSAPAAAQDVVEEPIVSSAAALELQLQTLLVGHRFDDSPPQQVRAQLQALERAISSQWQQQGTVAAAFGAVYAEIEDFVTAIRWYRRAVAAIDGSAGLKAVEQLGNLLARQGAKTRDAALVREGIDWLHKACALAGTVERESLLGSAYKRLADLVGPKAKDEMLAHAVEHYRAAERHARNAAAADLFYPAINRLYIELRQRVAQPERQPLDPACLRDALQSLELKHTSDPDFWSAISKVELQLYQAVAMARLASEVESTLEQLADLQRRVSSAREWDSFGYQVATLLHEYSSTPDLPSAEQQAVRKLLANLPGTRCQPELVLDSPRLDSPGVDSAGVEATARSA